jgi:hypothetical protein
VVSIDFIDEIAFSHRNELEGKHIIMKSTPPSYTVTICHQVHDVVTVSAASEDEAIETAFALMDAALGNFTLVDATASRNTRCTRATSGAEPIIPE